MFEEHDEAQALLLSVAMGDRSLTELEQIERLRGFEREVGEVERAMREHVNTLRVVVMFWRRGSALCHHDVAIGKTICGEHASVFHDLAEALRLSEQETRYAKVSLLLLDDLLHLFSHRDDAGSFRRLEGLLTEEGFDHEPMVRILGAAALLLFDEDVFSNMLHAENALHPNWRMEIEMARRAEREDRWREAFRGAGLDGHALQEILGMRRGPEFGTILRGIHAYAKGEAKTLPNLEGVREEVERRVTKARAHMSV